ncbi:MAG: hypothetical protein ACMVP2_11910 [Imperialibacter sp.]|uniref:hypothetical protein n=1 Tax=Imperialibacter sp. TaxID=2038411 RepID=UPI0030DD1A37|tara:strand:- start:2219 stop:2953 length:735 start_codon:yes stop_codon:yes gene_type:complete
MRKLLPLLQLAIGACLYNTAPAQNLVSQNPSIEVLSNQYDAEVGYSGRIFNGAEYGIKYADVVDHAFLVSEWQPGSINFLDRAYKGLELRYDIVNDLVVLKHYDPNSGISIAIMPAQEKINSFTLSSVQFVRLPPQVTGEQKSRFYELIADKEYKLVAKHTKEKFIDKSRGAPVVGFQHKVKLYLKKDDEFIIIRSKRALLKVLEDKKKELADYSRARKLYWNENPKRTAAILVGYYFDLKGEN